MKLDFEPYRPKRGQCAHATTAKPLHAPAKSGMKPKAKQTAISPTPSTAEPIAAPSVQAGTSEIHTISRNQRESSESILAHKRALKAAQMRRYRAKKAKP
jgi:hypothetical protein